MKLNLLCPGDVLFMLFIRGGPVTKAGTRTPPSNISPFLPRSGVFPSFIPPPLSELNPPSVFCRWPLALGASRYATGIQAPIFLRTRFGLTGVQPPVAADGAAASALNDITSGAAEVDPHCSITGMPVVKVWEAKKCIFMERSTAGGYAGLDNPVCPRKQPRCCWATAE